jgi:hypothetical protein
VQQVIEGVEIARITGSQPSEHHRLASIDHRTKLTGPAPRARSLLSARPISARLRARTSMASATGGLTSPDLDPTSATSHHPAWPP